MPLIVPTKGHREGFNACAATYHKVCAMTLQGQLCTQNSELQLIVC